MYCTTVPIKKEVSLALLIPGLLLRFWRVREKNPSFTVEIIARWEQENRILLAVLYCGGYG
jgi:hypothetical protein